MKMWTKKRWTDLFDDRSAKSGDYVVKDQKALAKVKPEAFGELCRRAVSDTGYDGFFAIDGIVIRENGDLEAFVWRGSLWNWKRLTMMRLELPQIFESAGIAKKDIEAAIEKRAAAERELREMFG